LEDPAIRELELCWTRARGSRHDASIYDDRLTAEQSRGKKVYVMASHSHYFEEYIYDTPEHGGHGLPGWIIGTAGAEQYRADILYGYLRPGRNQFRGFRSLSKTEG
jgi:hypothetical protein